MSNPVSQSNYNQYKIRNIVTKHKTLGVVYGITIPSQIAKKFENVKFTIEAIDDNIILHSGLDLIEFKKQVKNISFQQI